jgi:hypothetical protein
MLQRTGQWGRIAKRASGLDALLLLTAVSVPACAVYDPGLVDESSNAAAGGAYAGGEGGPTGSGGASGGASGGVSGSTGGSTGAGNGGDSGGGYVVEYAGLDAGGCQPGDDPSCPLICPEVCDGEDNDCDGVVDEGDLWADKGMLCTAGAGECRVAGQLVCDSVDPSAPLVCDAIPKQAQEEVCDGLDNNCDGVIDDTFPDADGDGIADCVDTDDGGGIVSYRRKKITIDAARVDETLTDFPVLVDISGDVDLTAARSDGRDLYFTEADGAAVLDCEIERWEQGSGTLVAWVRIPSVSSSANTFFYLYFGDGTDHSAEFTPSEVWSAGYEGVWHLDTSDLDSSGNGLNGTNNGSTDVAGRIGGARHFNGSNAFIDLGSNRLSSAAYFTITAWVLPDLSSGGSFFGTLINSQIGLPYCGSTLYIQRSNGAVGVYSGGWRWSSTDRVSDDTWAFVAVRTYQSILGGTIQSSVNGEPWETLFTGDTTGVANMPDGQLRIGCWAGVSGYYFNGVIDEVRVVSSFSSPQLSKAWIKAEYENQRGGSTFLTIENE